MDEYKDDFIEEAKDLIEGLEQKLIRLETEPENEELIASFFRVMHTLKGSSGMFGFNQIEKLAHLYETLLDQIRNHEQKMNPYLLSLSFKTIDFIRMRLTQPDSNAIEMFNELKKQLQESVGNETSVEQEEVEVKVKKESQTIGLNSCTISFFPEGDICQRGINPLNILEEVRDLAEKYTVKVDTHLIPNLDELNHTTCFFSWELNIEISQPISKIEDIFIFVFDEFSIDKIIEKQEPELELQEEVAIAETEAPNLEDQMKALSEHQTKMIKVSATKLDDLINLVSELITEKAKLQLIAKKYKIRELNHVSEKIDRLSVQFRDNALHVRLIPIGEITQKFRRLVRDLSLEMEKKIDFIVDGEQTELDKAMIDSVSGPLMHILRNSIDHGIEKTDERIRNNKPEEGVIKLTAFYYGSNVMIQIQDDGRGINLEAVKAKAVSKGVIAANEKLSEKEMYDLLFMPGFSMSEKISEISGRGVGMDILKRNIYKLQGEIDIDSELGLGTIVTIKLPITLSIVDTLHIRVGELNLLLPMSIVASCNEIEYDKIKNNTNKQVEIEEKLISYIDLRDEFEQTRDTKKEDQVVVVNYGEQKVGLVLDEIVGENQAVLKPLGSLYSFQEVFSGASILGDGQLALILEVKKLIQKIFNK